MLYIRTLLSPRSRTTQEAQVNHLLSKVGVTGRGELVGQCGGSLLQSLTKSMAPDKFMKVLLGKLEDLQTPQEKAKLLTLMHSAVCESCYTGNVLQELCNLNLGASIELKIKGEDWFSCLYRAYLSYLTKLPSVSQVYVRARSEGDVWYDSKTLLVDLFRLVNQINLLLDPLISTFNTIGRYYKERKKVFRPMYQLLRSQLALLYNYMQRAVDSLFLSYQGVGTDRLQVFLETVPELELIADRLEEFLMNKYFQGAKPDKRLYFKAEEVAKIDYYLKNHHH